MNQDIVVENYIRKAEVLKITDGDTIVCRVDMGYHVFSTRPLRLNRIDAPELKEEAGKIAKNHLIEYLPVGALVLVQTFKNPKDKYSRWLADIYYNGVCINDYMVEQGHAVYRTY